MASEQYQPILGMSDLAPPEIYLWQQIESAARDLMGCYGFREVRTPLVEKKTVFQRSLGEGTDVVQKEMYTLQSASGREYVLRPEGTAGLVRHVAGRGQDAANGRFYYWGPMFRKERPQAGRKRQFHQLGVEAIGAPNPAADAEVIALQLHLLSTWGLEGCRLELNTRGMPEDRDAVTAALREHLEPRRHELCEDCRRRFDANILRVLDCKNPACGAIVDALPPVTDFMSAEARAYLDEVGAILRNLHIDFVMNPRLVRGLDYYVHTVWEITHPGLGAQDALSGGGRYRIDVGGKSVEGVGFAMGLERVLTALDPDGAKAKALVPAPVAWIVSQGEAAFERNLLLVQNLRLRGVACGMDLGRRSMKAQMRMANRSGSPYVVIHGDEEIEKGVLILKKMADGTQEELSMPGLMERLVAAPLAMEGT